MLTVLYSLLAERWPHKLRGRISESLLLHRRVLDCRYQIMAAVGQYTHSNPKPELSEEEKRRLEDQASRLVPDFKAKKFQAETR